MEDLLKRKKIRTRFPPSPTGGLHLGSARTALFNWLYARHHNGSFILRLEDTDRLRSEQRYIDSILRSMEWLGLDWDEGPFYQTQRFGRYREEALRLVDEGKAYWCHCSVNLVQQKRKKALIQGDKPRYDGTCRDRGLSQNVGAVIRFKNFYSGQTVWRDLVKGNLVFNNRELDDLVILRSDGSPTYHLAVVVDDIDMKITHIIRGDDHVNNTPRQILLYQALGANVPNFAHLPMILGKDRTKLSKRHGAVDIMEYRDQGYLPEAMINALVRLGWAHGNQEIFSRQELINYFDLSAVGISSAVFNFYQLTHLNHYYIQRADPYYICNLLHPFLSNRSIKNYNRDVLVKAIPYLVARTPTLVKLAEWAEPYLVDELFIDEQSKNVFFSLSNIEILRLIRRVVDIVGVKNRNVLEYEFRKIAADKGINFSEVVQPLRVALTGRTASPGIFEVMAILGEIEVCVRLDKVLK